MTMPVDLWLVRHGESEGNLVHRQVQAGDSSNLTDAFLARHSSQYRLTDTGVQQAKIAGGWLREEIAARGYAMPGRYYVSTHIRALETAGTLALPDADWREDMLLRERDAGQLEYTEVSEHRTRFALELQFLKDHRYLGKPPNGESVADLSLRIRSFLDTLHRECSQSWALVVCHGEVMWSFRYLLERMAPRDFQLLNSSKVPQDRINNCQVIQYTRRSPVTGEVLPYLSWMRSVCPWDLSLSRNTWQVIERKKFSNAELLAVVEQVPHMVR